MITEQSFSILHVSQTMDIGVNAIRHWMEQYQPGQESQLDIGKPLTAEQHRIRKFEQVNRKLRSDANVLKKASAFFAREIKRAMGSSMISKTKAVPVAQNYRLLMLVGLDFTKPSVVQLRGCFAKRASVHLHAAFTSSAQSYGKRQLITALGNSVPQVGRYKVRCLMQQASLKPVWTY